MLVAINRTSKFAFVELQREAKQRTAGDFLRHLADAVPYKIHTVLTDNGIHSTTPGAGGSAAPLIAEALARGEPVWAHAFEYACAQLGIEHHLTKPKHPRTDGQVERMNRTISSQDIAAAMATIFSGSPITTVRDANRAVEVVLRADHAERRDIATLADLQIPTADGRSIPLRQVAELSYGVEEPIIWRRNRQALITVQADIAAGVQPGTVSAQLAEAVAGFAAGLPRGYRIAEGGSVEEAAKGSDSIIAVLPVTVLVMAGLLMIQLRSFVRMGLAMAMAPFGIIGVVLAMLPTGTPVGFVAQLGIIALAGMIIRNAVILIEEVDANRARGAAIREAVVEASKHRARPILLTALAAILGMIPIAPQVFWGPMAFAIIGGLAVATLLTLTLLPALLMICERILYPASDAPGLKVPAAG